MDSFQQADELRLHRRMLARKPGRCIQKFEPMLIESALVSEMPACVLIRSGNAFLLGLRPDIGKASAPIDDPLSAAAVQVLRPKVAQLYLPFRRVVPGHLFVGLHDFVDASAGVRRTDHRADVVRLAGIAPKVLRPHLQDALPHRPSLP